MKKISNKNLRLNKIDVSKLNALQAQILLGGNIPDPTKQETCQNCESRDVSICTRTTVDFNHNRSINTNC